MSIFYEISLKKTILRFLCALTPLFFLFEASAANHYKERLKQQVESRSKARTLTSKHPNQSSAVPPSFLNPQLRKSKEWLAKELSKSHGRTETDIFPCYADRITSKYLSNCSIDTIAIYELSINSKTPPLIAKIFTGIGQYEDYQREYPDLQKVNAFLERQHTLFSERDVKDHSLYKFPQIAKLVHGFSDTAYPVILLEKMGGMHLQEWLYKFTMQQLISKDEDTAADLHIAGRQIGNFHAYFAEGSPGIQSFKTMVHGDLHMKNVIYNFMTKRVAFIDNDRMGHFSEEKSSCAREWALLFFWQPTFIRQDLVRRYTTGKKSADEGETLKLRLERIDSFLRELKIGYLSAFSEMPTLQAYIDATIEDDIKDDSIDLENILGKK